MRHSLLELFLSIIRYLVVSCLVMLLTLSLATGQFPPPIKQTVKSIQALKAVMNMNQTTTGIFEAHKKKEQVLSELENADKPVHSQRNRRATASASDQASSQEGEADRIRVLEYEVALLKSKLNRSESEVRKLRRRVGVSPATQEQ